MRFTLGITIKYIDCNPTASMVNNPPSEYHLSNRWVLSFKQQITALNKVHNINNTNALGHKNVVFSSGNSTSTTLEVSITPPDY
jgi:hypothetical protein